MEPNDGRTLDVKDAAYLAGMVDGEGHLGLYVNKTAKRRGASLVPRLCVANTDRGLLDHLAAVTGGRIDQLAHAERRSPAYQVSLRYWQIRNILPQIRPYLLVKDKQADLILEYFALQDRGRLAGYPGVADEDWPRALAIADEMKRLNCRWVNLDGTSAYEATKLERRVCSVEECGRKAYRAHEWCFHHWKVLGDHPVVACQRCGTQTKVLREGKRFCSAECAKLTQRESEVGTRRQYRRLDEETVRAIVDAFNDGTRCLTTLAEQFGTERTNVRNILTGESWVELDLDLPPRELVGDKTGENHWTTRQVHPMRGESHPRGGAKLTEAQVREIRRRYAAGGVTQKQLAEEFGVALLAINHICQRKTWAHVTDD